MVPLGSDLQFIGKCASLKEKKFWYKDINEDKES